MASEINRVPLLDVTRGNNKLRDEIIQAVISVCDSGRFLHGPDVEELEQQIAQQCEVQHAVSCASGSDALLLALMAYDVGPGDEVIVPSFTFFATASAVWRLGAKVVFVDIEPTTFNIDPQMVAQRITAATKAVIPVHLFGQSANMIAIQEIAAEAGVAVIEDAAQAIEARYHDRAVGGLGDIGCFSFYPTKNLGGFGDGGMMTTDDAELADRLRILASHGMRPRYHHNIVGVNSRLDSIQAAVLRVKLKYLADRTSARQGNAARYTEAFRAAELDEAISLPSEWPASEHVWNQYTIRVLDGRRDALRAALAEAGIGTEIYYPVPLHRQVCFSSLNYPLGSLPETEKAADEVLSLPIFAELRAEEQHRVVDAITSFCRNRGQAAA